jgi:hypothetical protein
VLLIVLDALPWPWGEDILAGLLATVGLARSSRRREAAAWAGAQNVARPWRLAAALGAFRGRWIARGQLLGLRGPEELRQNLRVEGAEHLTAVPGAAILLGFHLGPPDGDLTFRVLGYSVTFLGWSDRAARTAWWSNAWRPFVEPRPLSFAAGHRERWSAVLYTGRRTLLDGGKVYIMADGWGREAFRLPLSVGEWPVGSGWLTLHRLTGAPVLPVVSHLEGRRHVITVSPPLPAVGSDQASGLEACRDSLTRLVEEYARRFPEQCPYLIRQMQRWPSVPLTAASASDPRTGPSRHSSGSG